MAVGGWLSAPGSPNLGTFESLTTATLCRPVSLKVNVATVPQQSWPGALTTLRQFPSVFSERGWKYSKRLMV